MKILLIGPQGKIYNNKSKAYKDSATYPSLTLVTLAALIPSALNVDISILDEGVDDTPIDYSVDIIAISAMTANIKRAYEIAAEARKRGVYVVLGGYHASYNYEEAKEQVDTVIIGQAEETWPQFLEDYVNGRPEKKYCQVSSPNVVNLPLPRWDLINWKHYLKVVTIQASRGCPNNCKYCNVSDNMFPGNNRPVEDIIIEIKHFKSKRIVFLDPNFFADRKYAMRLINELTLLKIKWVCLSTISVGKDIEMLKLISASGCIGVLVGLETVCQDNIRGMLKPGNKVDEYGSLLNNFHKYGIAVLACFVLGFDSDGINTFKETIDFIKRSKLSLVRFSALTPFPGTPLYKEFEGQGRITTRNWDLYDFQHVVYKPSRLTASELEEGLKICWDQIYSFKEILKRVLRAKNNRILLFILNMGFRKMYKAHFDI